MFQSITWQQYWIGVAIVCILYYLVVFVISFKGNFQLYVHPSGKRKLPVVNSETKEEQMPTLFGDNNNGNDDQEQIVASCMDELTAFFENQKKSKAIKSELMFSLYTILQKYPSLRNSDYKESLTNVIATQCENICSIHLSAEELKGVWFG